MGIDVNDWKEFSVRDIFNIQNGRGITTEEIAEHEGTLEAVQSGEDMFGTIGYIDWNYCVRMNYTMTNKPCLVVARSGTSGYVSYHDNGCVVGDSAKLLLLKDNKEADTRVYLFLQTLLNANRYKFSYGNKVTTEKYGNLILRLPASLKGLPDWAYIKKFMSQYYSGPLKTTIDKSHLSLNVSEWMPFKLGDLFEIKKGKRLTSEEQTDGDTIYIGAVDSNNGVAAYIGQRAIHEGNTISLSYNGSVGESFYQPDSFWATDDVNVLYFKKSNDYAFNPFIGLFISTVLRKEKYRFLYGRKWTLENMRDTIIRLPTTIDAKGNVKPDWQWMENYIRNLPFSDKITS